MVSFSDNLSFKRKRAITLDLLHIFALLHSPKPAFGWKSANFLHPKILNCFQLLLKLLCPKSAYIISFGCLIIVCVGVVVVVVDMFFQCRREWFTIRVECLLYTTYRMAFIDFSSCRIKLLMPTFSSARAFDLRYNCKVRIAEFPAYIYNVWNGSRWMVKMHQRCI